MWYIILVCILFTENKNSSNLCSNPIRIVLETRSSFIACFVPTELIRSYLQTINHPKTTIILDKAAVIGASTCILASRKICTTNGPLSDIIDTVWWWMRTSRWNRTKKTGSSLSLFPCQQNMTEAVREIVGTIHILGANFLEMLEMRMASNYLQCTANCRAVTIKCKIGLNYPHTIIWG